MKIQEALEDVTHGEIMFPSPKTSYMEGNTQKDGKTEIYVLERTQRLPEHSP
jgi:hypothetical protein